MTRTPEQAIAWTQKTMSFDDGQCKKMCRTAYDVESDGSEDAAEAWERTDHKHHDRQPPRGALVWWTGGRKGHGHVAISLGGGRIRSTDLPRLGHWGSVPQGEPERSWGLTYAGWSEDIDGVRVLHVPPTQRQEPNRMRRAKQLLAEIAADKKLPARRRARARAASALLPKE